MKVRHKQSGAEYTVVDIERRYWIVNDGEPFDTALPKSMYEQVPTEIWRDVTGECELGGTGCILHRRGPNDVAVVSETPTPHIASPYRLRKVVKADLWFRNFGNYAFIIEQKESA